MKHEIINNFLPLNTFKELQSFLLPVDFKEGEQMRWYYTPAGNVVRQVSFDSTSNWRLFYLSRSSVRLVNIIYRTGTNTHRPNDISIAAPTISCHKARPSVGPGYPPKEGVGICSSPIRSNSMYHHICSAARMANTNNTIPTAIHDSLVTGVLCCAGTGVRAQRCGSF